MAPINVTTSKQQITASVADDKITATVSAGFGATGQSGVINVTAPITNTGTTTNANVGLSVGTGLSVSGGSLVVTPNTYATLVDGKIPSSQLPSYVDDVIEVASYGDLPSPGEQGKIYVITGTNRCFRWSGFVYVEIVASPGTTDALPEGNVNLYHTAARAAAAAPVQSVNGQTGAVTVATYSLPVATASVLGGVKGGGSGISIDANGVISATVSSLAWDDITGKPSTFTPSSHNHGNITNDGKVGTAADKVLVTTTAGAVTAASSITFSQVADTATYTNFSTTAGNLGSAFSGIDSALDGKASTSHASTHAPGGSDEFTQRYRGQWSAGNYDSGELVYKVVSGGSQSSGQIATLYVCTDASTIEEPGTTPWTIVSAVPVSHAHSASDVTSGVFDPARIPQFDVLTDTVSSTTYTGRAADGSATSASVWKIRKTVYTSAGAVSSTGTASNVKWDDRLTASYS